jgi:hypothetical protein
MWKTLFTPKVTRQDDTHVRVEIWNDEEEVGTLYYERPKKDFNRKPVFGNNWVCVDAHIEYFANMIIKDHPEVDPKDIIGWGNEAIKASL